MYVYNTASAFLFDFGEGTCILTENKTDQLLGATLFSNGETFMVSDPILYLSKSSLFFFVPLGLCSKVDGHQARCFYLTSQGSVLYIWQKFAGLSKTTTMW